MKKFLALGILMLSSIVGCATWSTTSVDQTYSTATGRVMITENDITDRKYEILGDVTVTANKTTMFHPNPTREMVNQLLREEGVKMGADAVILVRYRAGISLLSWGTLEGKGRAIKFVPESP